MRFGDKFNFSILEDQSGTKIKVVGMEEGINITPMDFGRDLVRRQGEGVYIDPNEEIDVEQGIVEEHTTGEDIVFTYDRGNLSSSLLLVGTLAKKKLGLDISAKAIEIGGISTNEKNAPYITVAVQKMVMNSDSMGGIVECNLPWNIDMKKFRGNFSKLLLECIDEVVAIDYGSGRGIAKETAKKALEAPKRVVVSFAPATNGEHPCPAITSDVVVEAIAAIVIANM